MIQSLSLPDFKTPRVTYGFFGCRGGVSEGIYAQLNGRLGSNDNPAHVAENRRRIANHLGAAPENLLSLYQIHSSNALFAGQPWGANRPEADAMVTTVPGLALGILTADCTPVLFYGETAQGVPVIGAAHAGWRGAFSGILEETVALMKEKGAVPDSLRAAIGPCITRRSYEVSEEFYVHFCKEQAENERFFSGAKKPGHHMFDLPGYCAARLRACGLSRVVMSDVDTYANVEDYFSYRRTTHRNEKDYGGQISAIMIKD